MSVAKVVCPNCGAAYKLPPGAFDKRLRCVKCRAVFRVMTPASPSDSASRGDDATILRGAQAAAKAADDGATILRPGPAAGVASQPPADDSATVLKPAAAGQPRVEDPGVTVLRPGGAPPPLAPAAADGPPAAARHKAPSRFPDAPDIGEVIGDCQIVDKLGEGGMGIVYRAVRRMLKREVALKVLPKSVSDRDPAYAERFIKEAQSAARLAHPNIVAVYNVGRDGDRVFMEMEFVKGKSLSGVIEAGPMSEREATRVIQAAAAALGYAHEQGIVHRDIKPDNMLLTDDGAVKITDFGLAGNVWDRREVGLVADATAADALAAAGAIMGTPHFMSPQQCRGEAVDARTDIYALGATFYNLLCGAKPFDDPDVMAIIEKHQREPVPDVRARAPAVSRTAADAICKAMAKDLKDRFQTCEEFARALSAGEGGGDESGTGERGEEFWNSFAKMLRGVRKDKP